MALKILSAEKFGTKLKATIQSTGRLGFTEKTADYLQLSVNKSVRFAQEGETDELFLCINDKRSVDSFSIRLSGKYYYVPTTALFDAIGFDYKKNAIMFDLVRAAEYDEVMNGCAYKMKKREILKKE